MNTKRIVDKTREIQLDIRERAIECNENSDLLFSKEVLAVFENHQSFFINNLGAVHPSLMFHDLVRDLYTTITTTVFMDSGIGQPASNEADFIPIIPAIGVSVFQDALEKVFDEERLLKLDELEDLINLIYLPLEQRSNTASVPPEYLDSLLENNRIDYLETPQEIIAQKSSNLINSFSSSDAVGDFIRSMKEQLSNALEMHNALVTPNRRVTLLRFFDHLADHYRDLNVTQISSIELDQVENSTPNYPKEQYAFLLLLLNAENSEKNCHLKFTNSLSHVVYLLDRDYSSTSITTEKGILGLVAATHAFPEFNRNQINLALESNFKIWSEFFSVFRDIVIIDRLKIPHAKQDSLKRVLSWSGHTLKNELKAVDVQLRSLIALYTPRQNVGEFTPFLNRVNKLGNIFSTLTEIGSTNFTIPAGTHNKGDDHLSLVVVRELIEKLMTDSHYRSRNERDGQTSKIYLTTSLDTDLTSDEIKFKPKVNIDANLFCHKNAEFTSTVLETVIFEILLNAARYGVPDAESSSEKHLRIPMYIIEGQVTIEGIASPAFVFGNRVVSKIAKYSNSFSQFKKNSKASLPFFAEVLDELGVASVYFRSYTNRTNKADSRLEIILVLGAVNND